MERLNLTSAEATARVGRNLNNRYKRLTSSIGMDTSRFTQVSKAATIGNQSLTFTGIEKVNTVIDKSSGKDLILEQLTQDEMHQISVRSEPPRHFSVTNMHYNTVTIYMDCVPTTTFTLYADGIVTLSTLSGTDVPDFPESFHEILVFGTMADEYRKMEKPQLAQAAELDYEKRLSDLRMFIAKTAWLDIYQGKDINRYPWMRNGIPWGY